MTAEPETTTCLVCGRALLPGTGGYLYCPAGSSDEHDEREHEQQMEQARRQWRAEARERVTVVDQGSVVVVNVDGHEVARYLTWAALVTKVDRNAAAEAYADELRDAYVRFQIQEADVR